LYHKGSKYLTTQKQKIMKISANYLAKKLFISYAKEELAKGKTEQEVKKGFTLEVLNEKSKKFCKEYGFQLVD